jgi:hypothetical protein
VAVQASQPPHAVGHLVDGHRAGGIPRVGSPLGDVLHHDHVVEGGAVDDHLVGERMVDQERHARREQLGLVEHVAVPSVDLAVLTLGLCEDDIGP